MTSTKPSRTRPTNNQLLYKAHFRWEHYSYLPANFEPPLPDETEACASVTSAFLQVLSTLYTAEGIRGEPGRNILELLSNNTRRTKVVELSSGTHRVPDELKRHSLTDQAGNQYSTNLDRNRYGADNQYLSTVIRYDLDYLSLCPCLVDVEIIDAKNGSGTVIVAAGNHCCNCSGQAKPLGPKQSDAVQVAPLKMANNAGQPDNSSGEVVKPDSPEPPLFAASAKSGGSGLFDALLMAATGGTETTNRGLSAGEPPVNSKQSAQLPRPRSRLWNYANASAGEVDSLQNAINTFAAEEEIASGAPAFDPAFPASRTGPRSARSRPKTPLPRRSSASNMQDLAAAKATTGTSRQPRRRNRRTADHTWSPAEEGHACKTDEGSRSADDGTASMHSQEGDTEAAHAMVTDEELEAADVAADNPVAARGPFGAGGLHRPVGRQSSAVNLNRLGRDAELKRLVDEVRMLKEERVARIGAVEEARSKQLEQQSRADALQQDLEVQRSQVQRHLTQVSALRVDVQRLSQGKQAAEARAAAAEAAQQQCQQQLAALRMLTASMLSQAQPPGFPELEGTESAKPGFTAEGSNSVVDTLTQQQASRVADEVPSSANFWGQAPSPSNIQSSQSSVLEGLGSAPLPIDQLQLKSTSLPGLTLPHQLPGPWGSGSTDNSPPGLSQGIAMQGSSQTPWLSAWSNNAVHKPASVPASKEPSDSHGMVKRERGVHENGEPVDSKPSKRPKFLETCACKAGDATDQSVGKSEHAQPADHDGVLTVPEKTEEDVGSPNTSSHSSSPETAVTEPEIPAAALVLL